MRKLTYFIGCSVDGRIAATDGSLDAFFPLPDGLVEHIVAEYPQTLPTHLHEAMGVTDLGDRFDAVVMGRGTYEPGVAQGVTSPYSHLEQHVVSSGLTSADPAINVIAGDPVTAVKELKNRPGGGIWLAGGGKLAAALLPEIDELVLKIYPFVLGTGIGVFDGEVAPTHLALTGSHVLGSGAAIHTYTRR
ncbi:RibD C-terminal domain-containing protein [Saccharopolyspora kobensis]|uniref:RibD C-terminal domain-containing protein n=1 Tax=Saccharopolyspora kobensis TaxID=146035 RepID=A0A1H6EJS1_9PSEU|nr:dihydrofolate reductase family protein [Saccharopolyspora kobensis]SEG97553.1 RibD C-terminal domain-containing protein [Saccharopolyspora kobensis]SFE94383.1 RibD C-terminal domain-containing protein [Saccharopolyspora kobensis]